MKLKKNPLHFIDKEGFVIHQEPDLASRGGDSSQRTGMFLVGSYSITKDKASFANKVAYVWTLMHLTGEPVRHWDSRFWPGRPGIMSRDNLVPMFCCLVLGGFKKLIHKILLKLILRLGFTWNTRRIGQELFDKTKKLPDFCGPMIWFIYLRSLPLTKPLHFVFDAYLWCAVEIRMHKAYKDWDDVGDDLNLIVLIETARLISDNWLLKRIRTDYLKLRPQAGPSQDHDKARVTGFDRGSFNGPQNALRWYFHDDSAPPLDDLWIEVLKSW